MNSSVSGIPALDYDDGMTALRYSCLWGDNLDVPLAQLVKPRSI